MRTESSLIQSDPLQIRPSRAQSVRTGAETARSFGELLETESKTIAHESQEHSKSISSDQTVSGSSSSADDQSHESSKAESGSDSQHDSETSDRPSVQDGSGQTAADSSSEHEDGSTEHGADGSAAHTINADGSTAAHASDESNPEQGNANAIDSTDPVVASNSAQSSPEKAQTTDGATTGSVSNTSKTSVVSADTDSMVALSRQAERSRFQIQGVARELTHAATVDVAQTAIDELSSKRIPGTDASSADADDQSILDFKDLKLAPLKTHDDRAPVQENPVAKTVRAMNGQQTQNHPATNAESTADVQATQQSQPTTIHHNAAAVASASGSAPLLSDAIRSVLDRIQNVRSLTSATNASGIGAAAARPSAVSAIANTNGGSIGSDGGAPTKFGVLRQTATTGASERNAVLAQVQKGLASVLRKGGGSMMIRLKPGHLGDLRIQLDIESGGVRARFETQTEGARDSLEHGLKSLREQLENKGVRVDELRVEHRSEGFASSSGQRDPEEQRHNEQNQHAQRPNNESTHDHGATASDRQTDQEDTRGIWTELGLDAVA